MDLKYTVTKQVSGTDNNEKIKVYDRLTESPHNPLCRLYLRIIQYSS